MSPHESPWSLGRKRLWRNRAAVASLLLLGIIAGSALFAPWLTAYGYDEQNLADQNLPPSWSHPFGTDAAGRDLYSRILYGGRISLAVGLVATIVSLVIGVGWGMIAGWFGGRTDEVMMRFVDMLYSLPFMFFVILLVAYFGRSLVLLFLALGAVQWLTMSRIVRGEMKRLRRAEFVEAALSLGVPRRAIFLRHLLPNMLGPILVYATLTVPAVMLEEAFLSFLGLGVQPPMSSWGSLANEGATALNAIRSDWWLLLFPGVFLAATLLSLNFLGDGLRDAFDPKLSRR
ncbi:MAG TPA: ABC transporter permease [Candidatus Krumholzibacteria bacterium]